MFNVGKGTVRGEPDRHALPLERNVVAAQCVLRDRLPVLVGRTDADGNPGNSGDRLERAYELERAEDATVSPQGSGFRGVTLAHNVSSKEEVDRVMTQAKQAGATIVKPAQDVFWGGYSGYFADPDGHLWEVAWNPFTWIGPPDTGS